MCSAQVGPKDNGDSEFGYYQLFPTEAGREFIPDGLHVVQMHYHTFALPAGATRLASSALFDNQAFRYGEKTFAFQFHPEVTPEGFARAQTLSAMYERRGAQTRREQDRLQGLHDGAQGVWFESFLARLFGRT